jgi:prepilin-type N-terminal cleavage/methylation domain-containing protein
VQLYSLILKRFTLNKKGHHGFTLLELLIVVGIIAILAIVIVIVINPAELLKKSRDAQRISDLTTLKKAIGIYLTSTANPKLAGANNTGCKGTTGSSSWQVASDHIYYSYPSDVAPITATALDGVVFTGGGGAAQVTKANVGKTDGTGWLPINFNTMPEGSPISNLPTDPVNTIVNPANPASTDLVYRYICSEQNLTYEIDATLESGAYSVTDPKMAKDAGNNDSYYEVGTNLTLFSVESSSLGSYGFTDDGTASTSPFSGIAAGGGFTNGTNTGTTVSGAGVGASVGITLASSPVNAWSAGITAVPAAVTDGSNMIRNAADNDIYVTVGGTAGFYKYSISGNSWTTLTSAPAAIGDGSSIIRNGSDNDIYVTRGGLNTQFYKYSISGNSWTSLTAVTGAVYSGSKMLRNGSDNDIYIAQGGNDPRFYKYSISGNSWTSLTSAPAGIYNGGTAIRNGADNDIYVLGGGGGTGFYKYSISGNSWTTLTAPPATIGNGSSVLRNGADNDIYVMRGSTSTGFYKYSISGNSWTTLAVTPAAINYGSKMIRNGSDNEIYVTQGNNATGFYKYSISGNSFTTLATATGAINYGGTMIRNGIDNDLYVTGGGALTGFYKYVFNGPTSYAATATFTSAVIDAGAVAGFTTISYDTTLPASTAITMDVRGSLDNVTWTGWTTGVASGGSIASLAGNRYFQYRANLSTSDPLNTPLLNSVTVNYTQ